MGKIIFTSNLLFANSLSELSLRIYGPGLIVNFRSHSPVLCSSFLTPSSPSGTVSGRTSTNYCVYLGAEPAILKSILVIIISGSIIPRQDARMPLTSDYRKSFHKSPLCFASGEHNCENWDGFEDRQGRLKD